MSRLPRFAPVLVALAVVKLGCNHPAVEPPTSDPEVAPEQSPPDPEETTRCESAPCLEGKAERALDEGRLDVASSLLLRAFEVEREPARLDAYLSRLATNGQVRALRGAVESHAEAFPEVVGPYRDRVVEPITDRPTLPLGPQPGLARSLAAARRGDTAEALALLADPEEPGLWALQGRMHLERGETAKARAAYARARIAIDERGASMRLAPYETSFATAIAFVEGYPVRISGWRPRLSSERVGVSQFEFLGGAPSGDRHEVVDRRMVPRGQGLVAGDRFYAVDSAGGQELVVFDMSTGARLGALEAPLGPEGSVHVLDEGPGRRFLITPTQQRLALYRIPESLGADAELERLGEFAYAGTTPTITRVYTGNGTEHDNILDDTPSWPVSFAVSPEEDYFAYGTSDSRVHLHRMGSERGRTLKVQWDYKEVRMGGANADRNNPLALKFTEAGLVVVYGRGDVLTFSMAGKRVAWRKGECSGRALRRYARRYGEALPSEEDREGCGRFQSATLSPSGERVAGTGSFDLRVIPRAPAGEELEAHLGTNLGAHVMAWASATRVLYGNLYGQVWDWREGEKVRSLTEDRDGMANGPRTLRLGGELRILQWGGDYRPLVVWDLWTGERLREDAAGHHLRASSNAAYTVEPRGEGVVVRDGAGERVYPFRAGTCDSASFLTDAGSVVLATQGKRAWVVDLERGLERELDVGEGWSARPREELALSADGQRLAVYAENAVISVFDAESGARLKQIPAEPGEYRRALAIAPDGSWVAWQEQMARDGGGLPNVNVHLAGLVSGVEDRETTVAGWTKALVAHPGGSELLLITENALTRWNPRTGEVIPEEVGYISANAVHYSADGRTLIVENYDRVDLRANAPGLPVVARLYALEGDEWFVETGSGAVDGSVGARGSLATVVEGALDTSVLPGAVAWDRLVVPGLMAEARRHLVEFPPASTSTRP